MMLHITQCDGCGKKVEVDDSLPLRTDHDATHFRTISVSIMQRYGTGIHACSLPGIHACSLPCARTAISKYIETDLKKYWDEAEKNHP